MPSPETLALIASNLSKAAPDSPGATIDCAFELWRQACLKIQSESEAQQVRDGLTEVNADIPMPDRFPASADDFFRLIIRSAKTPADATKRFRDFVRYRVQRFYTPEEGAELTLDSASRKKSAERIQNQIESDVANLMAKYKKTVEEGGGIRSESAWRSISREYKIWWKGQLSAKRTAAAKKR